MRNIYDTTQQTDKAQRFNQGKLRIGLIPFQLIYGVTKVLMFGADKYEENQWQRGLSWTETFESLQRHLYAWYTGEELDEESGLPHLWHAGCNIAFLITYRETGAGVDDRYKHNKQ